MPSLCFSPRGCVFSHGMHGTHRSLGCVFSPRTHLGGYGILPYPRRPPRGCSGLRCTNRALVHQHCNPPTESTEHTEASGVEEPPTDFTDAHRWLGCVWFSHGIHGIHRSFWRRRASHRFHRCTQMVRLLRVLPRNSRNSQKLLAEKSLPQISQMPTDG